MSALRVAQTFLTTAILVASAGLLHPGAALGQAPPDRWLGPDKPVHVLGAYTAAGGGYALGIARDGDAAERRRGALAAGLLAAIGKESFDALIQHEPFSWKDLAAGAVGAVLWVGLTTLAES